MHWFWQPKIRGDRVIYHLHSPNIYSNHLQQSIRLPQLQQPSLDRNMGEKMQMQASRQFLVWLFFICNADNNGKYRNE
jgi:hypothetical protein